MEQESKEQVLEDAIISHNAENSIKTKSFSKNLFRLLLWLFTFVNATSSTLLYLNFDLLGDLSIEGFVILFVVLFVCQFCVYAPSKAAFLDDYAEHLSKELSRFAKSEHKRNAKCKTFLNVMALVLFSVITIVANPIYAMFIVSPLYFIIRFLIDETFPSLKIEIREILEKSEIIESYDKDKENEEELDLLKSIEIKEKAKKWRKVGKVIGIINATLVNGFLVTAGFASNFNNVLEKFNLPRIFEDGITDIPGWESALIVLMFAVGIYASYQVTSKATAGAFYSIAKKYFERKEKRKPGNLKPLHFIFGVISIFAAVSLTYVSASALWDTLVYNWKASMEISYTVIIIATIFTAIVAPCLIGYGSWSSFRSLKEDFNDKGKSNAKFLLVGIFAGFGTSIYAMSIITSDQSSDLFELYILISLMVLLSWSPIFFKSTLTMIDRFKVKEENSHVTKISQINSNIKKYNNEFGKSEDQEKVAETKNTTYRVK